MGMNDQQSKSVKARGKLRAILDENEKAAAEEVAALDNLFQGKISEIRKQADDDATAAKHDLESTSQSLYEEMAAVQKANIYANEETATAITEYSASSLKAVQDAKRDFTDRLDTLTNVVAANHKKVEKNFEILTGVVRDFKEAGEADRALIRAQNDALNAEMLEAIDTAIQVGEAKAKAVAQRARASLKGTSDALLIEITDTVEEYADKTFKLIQGNQQKVADNYLSLKAYAVTASEKLSAYVAKGKGKNLSSLGDLLVNIAFLSDVEVEAEEGISPTSEIPQLFSNGKVKVDNSVSKIWSGARVHHHCEQLPREVANGPGQVPAPEARGSHEQEGCPPGGQSQQQGWQLRVYQRPRSGSVQQAQRLRGPCCAYGHLLVHPRQDHCKPFWQAKVHQGS